jgi:hypothetical protein
VNLPRIGSEQMTVKDLFAETVHIDGIVCRMAGVKAKNEPSGTPPAFGKAVSSHCSADKFFSQDA